MLAIDLADVAQQIANTDTHYPMARLIGQTLRAMAGIQQPDDRVAS